MMVMIKAHANRNHHLKHKKSLYPTHRLAHTCKARSEYKRSGLCFKKILP